MPVSRDRERVPMLDSVHDLARSGPQIALRDLRLITHIPNVAPGATWQHSLSWSLRPAASGEQGVAPVLALAHAGRAGEHAAAGVLDVLVQRVGAEGVLQLDELGRVLHERDEEQAAQQRAPLGI